MQPDHSFDYYLIDYWPDDGRYRLSRHRAERSRQITHYLYRDTGGCLLWGTSIERAESWDAVQSAAVCLIHVLNQQGVIG